MYYFIVVHTLFLYKNFNILGNYFKTHKNYDKINSNYFLITRMVFPINIIILIIKQGVSIMKKDKWIQQEIDKWKNESLISDDVAITLKERYTPKKNTNYLIILFSVIGALLIGTGIILIFAKNWYELPKLMRVVIAFLPLIISQCLSVFTLKCKQNSIAWREAVAILVTASVFTVIALVGQIFHLPGNYGTYVLTCGLLSLPMIFILDAASPLLVYYWTILNWAALDTNNPVNAFILLGLFAMGVLFLVLKRKQVDGRLVYMTWITVIAGFVATLIMGIIFEYSLLLMVLCYFVLLLSVNNLSEKLLPPFKIIGTIGTLITLSILTYRDVWSHALNDSLGIGGSIMAGCLLLITLFFAIKIWKTDKLKFSFILISVFVCILRYIWAAAHLSIWPYEFIFMMISNVVLLAVGIGFIVHGTKNMNLITTNIGMATTCVLILMRFFDSNMDFLWRGVVFLILGTAFLLVNLRFLRIKKLYKQEAER